MFQEYIIQHLYALQSDHLQNLVAIFTTQLDPFTISWPPNPGNQQPALCIYEFVIVYFCF